MLSNNPLITYSNEKPKIYDRCVKEFGVSWDKGIIITYGDVVHCKYQLPDHLKIHESTHVHQQMIYPGGKDAWWDKYFIDKKFRMNQEVEAYKAQIEYADKIMNRLNRKKLKSHILTDLVRYYGDMCTKEEAQKELYGN